MSSLLDKRLVVVTGKGGVGKTTVAAALGLLAARSGRRTILCEVGERSRVPELLGAAGDGSHAELRVAERLWAIGIDPEEAQREYLRDQLPSRTMAKLLADSRLFGYLSAATPGLRELLAVGKVWELAQPRRRDARNAPYDLVVVDAPATGHGIALLDAPRSFRDAARVGPVARQADIIHGFLADPARTAVVAVALPEEMPVNETIELAARLRELGFALDRVIVNAVYPQRYSAAEARRLAAVDGRAGGPAVHAAVDAALSEHRRARTQRSQIARLRRAHGGVTTLPYLFEPDGGAAGLERLSRELERRL